MAAIPVTFQGILCFSDTGVGGGPMPGGPHPSHPIAPGGPPPGYWGGVAPPYPDQGLPGQQPGVSHPIAPGGRPPGIWGGPPLYPDQGLPGQPPGYWGGVAPPYPDQGLPGQPPRPSQGGPFPSNPIVLPPYQPGGPPVTIWPSPGHPSHPIVIPPPPPPPPDAEAIKPPPEAGGWAYAPAYGWGYFPGTSGAATPK
jgi:hypothetical protein